ncbi:Laminin subunit alpha-2 [Stenotrophomonas sp.]|uniref:Laminin subunit alpha-2 n=1 Tax=Stenotrophomonas sp. TaxID=69392 RepID=UPI0028A638FD|nr:Laminin subunit alpha-2 [Stenotrophomonas sp.]
MANNAAFQEALRLVLETSGTDGVDELRQALAEMGVASEDAAADTGRLVDQLAELNATADKAESFDGLLASLSDLEKRYDANQKAAYQLSLQIAAVDEPSQSLLNVQKSLRAEGDKLKESLNKQWEAAANAEKSLAELGVNTSQLAASQQRLREEASKIASAFADQARAAAEAAEETRRRNRQIQEGDDRFRSQAKASTAAADSLRAYRERAGEAARETAELGASAAVASSVLGKLKGIAAAALGFIGFGKVVDGIKAIIKEGSDAEQELGQLQAALFAAGRQGEFTAEQLAEMRKQLEGGLFDDGEISAAQVRLLSYTNIVGQQFPAAMQITIDQAQRLGISLEASAEVVGKALQTPSKAMESLTKQGFTLDDSQKQLIKQLEATGRVAEAQTIILDLLAESYGGAAAAAKVGKIAGLWKAATERFKDWKQEVADQGVLVYFKAQLSEILTTADRLAKDGTLTRWAKQTAEAIITLANAAKGATVWVVEHSSAIAGMAKAFAAFAIIKAIVQLNSWRIGLIAATRAQWANVAAMDAAGKGAVTLGNLLRAIPSAVPITIALVGLDVAIKGLRQMGEALGEELAKNSAASQQAGEFSRLLRDRMYEEAVARKAVANSLIQYRDVAVKTSAEVAALSDAERAAYQRQLESLRAYLAAQVGYLERQKQLGLATDEQIAQLDQVYGRLAQVRQGFADITEGARVAGDALTNGIGPGAQLVLEKLGGIDKDAKLAAASIGKLFQDLNFSDTRALEDVAVALAHLAEEGGAAGRNIRDGLLDSLQRLSGEELMRFQMAAQEAFGSLPKAAVDASAVLEQTLVAALQKLGVTAESVGMSFGKTGRDAVAAFATVTDSALATGVQIEAAFKKALGNVSTRDEAAALGALLEDAGRRGKVGFDQAQRSASALNARIRDITNAMNPLNDEFGKLGIQSQASLDAARDSAKAAFEAIKRGASQGKASIEDVRRAFKAYADTARNAVADSDASAKSLVDGQLAYLGAIYQVNDGLSDMGSRGEAAAGKIATGAATAASELDGVAASAGNAAAATEQVAKAGGAVAGGLGSATVAAQGFSLSMGEISDKAQEMLNQISGPNGLEQFANVWNGLFYERRDLEEYRKELERTVKGLDDMTEQRQSLRSRFRLVSDGELDQVLQLETQITAQQEARDRASREATAERRRAAEAEVKAQAEADARRVGSGASAGVDVLRIEWTAPSRSVVASASASEREQAERLADLVAPLVLQKIARSKSVSSRPGGGR